MRLVLLLALAACRTEYTRCEAHFADDPNGLAFDDRVMEPLGSKDPKDAKCTASLGLCEAVESRALQGVPDAKHEPVCKTKPAPFTCDPSWLAKFTFTCESQKVGGILPF